MSEYEIKRHIEEQKVKSSISELVGKMGSACNSMGMDKPIAEGLAEGLMKLHPTLRQSLMHGLLEACIQIDKEDRHVDLRSQASRDLIKHIACYQGALPFI